MFVLFHYQSPNTIRCHALLFNLCREMFLWQYLQPRYLFYTQQQFAKELIAAYKTVPNSLCESFTIRLKANASRTCAEQRSVSFKL